MLSTLVQGFGPEVHAILVIVLGVWAGTLGLPVPEEIPLLTAGIMAAVGILPLHVAILVGIAACFSADVTVFAFGRRVGHGLQRHPRVRRFMRGRYLLRARHLYLHRGRFTMFVARLVPGLKMPYLLTAGAFHMPWPLFLARDILTLFLLVPALVLLSYSSSLSLAQLALLVRHWGLVTGLAFAAGLVIWLWLSRGARRRRAIWRARCVAAGMKLRGPVKEANLTESWD